MPLGPIGKSGLMATLLICSCSAPPAVIPTSGDPNSAQEPSRFRIAAVTNTLAGQFLDANTGRPIPDGVVSIAGTSLQATADSWGYYYLANVPKGTQQASFSRTGFTTLTTNVAISSSQLTRYNPSLTIAVAGTGTISGTISNAVTGAGIANAPVYLNQQVRGRQRDRRLPRHRGDGMRQAAPDAHGVAEPGFANGLAAGKRVR